MAATAAAAMSSSSPPPLSPAAGVYTVKCIRSSSIHSSPADHPHLKMSPNRMPSPPLLSHTSTIKPLISISSIGTSSKFRVLRITTTCVTQEGVAVTDGVEVGQVVLAEQEEEKQAEEEVVGAVEELGGGGGEAAAGEVSGEEDVAVNTKLYFGNIPYSVDSAQLAGIIHDYASPGLNEDFFYNVNSHLMDTAPLDIQAFSDVDWA